MTTEGEYIKGLLEVYKDRIARAKEELSDRMDVEDTDHGPRADFNMRVYMILDGSDQP